MGLSQVHKGCTAEYHKGPILDHCFLLNSNSNSNLYSSIKGNFAWVLHVHVVLKMTSTILLQTINHIYNHYESFTVITY